MPKRRFASYEVQIPFVALLAKPSFQLSCNKRPNCDLNKGDSYDIHIHVISTNKEFTPCEATSSITLSSSCMKRVKKYKFDRKLIIYLFGPRSFDESRSKDFLPSV